MSILEAIKNVNYRDVAVRAVWTFIQSFLAVVLLTSDAFIDLIFKGDWTGLWALIISTSIAGLAAGLSAIKSIVLDVVRQIKQSAGV